MKTKKIFSGLFLSIVLFACDKVNDPYVTTSPTGGGGPTTKVRKVLIEDYTGQKCGNCPTAASTIQTIKGKYGERVVSIAVHVGFYAVPAAAPYNYDFRTLQGNTYEAFFQPPGFPNGMVNRKNYSLAGGHWKNVGSWGSIVDTLMAIAPDADIQITNNYNSSTRLLNTSIKSQFLKPLNGAYGLIVLLTEDSIIKPQYFGPPNAHDELNYVHHHVLRDGIPSTSSWGDTLVSGLVAAGDSVIKSYQYTLPASFPATNGIAPDEKHCSVVAYIYNLSTYEVMQVEEKKIK